MLALGPESRLAAEELILRFSVSLLVLYRPGKEESEKVRLAGSGTLVRVGDSRYILTAEHVWSKGKLKDFEYLALDLYSDGRNQRFSIPMKSIVLTNATNRKTDEFGPDVCFLRIPRTKADQMEAASKVFYNLGTRKESGFLANEVEPPQDGPWAVVGAPEELGRFTGSHARLNQMVYWMPLGERFSKEGFDYVDFSFFVATPRYIAPSTFRGVSGGGLWQVTLRESRVCGADLDGLAFL